MGKSFWSKVGKALVTGAVWAAGHPEVVQMVTALAEKKGK
jgi:hypothetical protein